MRKQSRHTTLAHLPPPRDSPASSRANGPPGGHFRCLPVAGVLLGVAVAFFCAQGRADEADNPDAVRPLPEIDRGVFDRIRFAALGDPQDLSEPLMADDVAPPGQPRQEFEPPAGRKLPPGAKPGILQQALFTVTELPKFGSNGLGLTNLEQSITLGLPAPTPASPLLVTAGFVGTLVDKPTGVDMPNELFEGYVQARWLRKLTEKLGMDLAVSPGWYSDFKNDTPQAMRITGHGFGAWEATENLRVIAGLIYLDRYDVNMLPAGGLLWTPSDSTRFELIFPRPRLAWRVAESQRAAQWLADRLRAAEGPRYRRVPPGTAAPVPVKDDPARLRAAMDKMVEAPPAPSLDHMGVRRRPLPELLGRLRESIARLREVSFDQMVADCDRLEEALTLLAALELVRRGEAELRQDAPFGDIIITGTRA